jgi:hypothetical protein
MKNILIQKFLLVVLLFHPLFVISQNECSIDGFKVDSKKTPTSTYSSFETRTICQLPQFYETDSLVVTNIYGSRTDKQTNATGFFYVKMIDGRWWVVDPDGFLNICRAVNAISTGKGTTSLNAMRTKFGNRTSTWMTKTMEYLNEIGFNGAGCWSTTSTLLTNPRQLTNPLAYTIILNWMSGYGSDRTYQQSGHMGYPNDAIFVFEQGFVDYCEDKAKALVSNKNDKNLFGYFTDNELPFYNNSLNKFLRLGLTNPADVNYLATKKWLADRNCTEADTTNADIQAQFLGFVGQTYTSIVYNAIKKYDPNHMVLGPRVNVAEARNNKYFMQAVGNYVDILAVNYYGVWTPSSRSMDSWGTNLGKPFMVTEFYTKGEDSGMGNTTGAGWIVPTQLDRGYEYQNYTLALLENKYCVGWHWFKYMDNDPTTPGDPSNIDGNKGLVKIDYEPYLPLTEKMKELNLRAYNLIDYFDSRIINTVDIFPEADAYYKDAENHGVDDRLGIKNNSSGNMREAFLRFDLTGQNKDAQEVNLKLSVLRSGDAGMTYKAEFVADDTWTESSITLANHPNGVYEIGNWTHGNDVSLNVKKPFDETIDSDQKLSIKLSATKTVISQLEYASRENPSVELRPRIEILEKAPDGPVDVSHFAELIIQNNRVASFQPTVFNYIIALPENTTANPSIAFDLPNSAMEAEISGPIDILSNEEADRTATIATTSANGLNHSLYTLVFEVENSDTTTVGARHNLNKPEFSVYPNPARSSDCLVIELNSRAGENSLITLFNMYGKSIFHRRIEGTKCVIETDNSLVKGVYFISVCNIYGVSTLKMVIK